MDRNRNYTHAGVDHADRDLNHVEFHDPQSGRTWTVKDVDEFIVSRLHGDYNLDQCLIYVTYTNVSLANITAAELERFWNNVLMNPRNPHVAYWAEIPREDPRAQMVLIRIRVLLLQVQGIMLP